MICIPKKLKLGPYEYKVKCLNGDEEDEFWGRHHLEELEIRVKKGLAQPHAAIVYLHEVLHAMDEIYCGKGLEEEQIHSLAYALYDFLTNNKIFK